MACWLQGRTVARTDLGSVWDVGKRKRAEKGTTRYDALCLVGGKRRPRQERRDALPRDGRKRGRDGTGSTKHEKHDARCTKHKGHGNTAPLDDNLLAIIPRAEQRCPETSWPGAIDLRERAEGWSGLERGGFSLLETGKAAALEHVLRGERVVLAYPRLASPTSPFTRSLEQ